VASVEDSKNVFQKLVQEHKETLVPGSPRDFIDSYLEKIAETKDLNSSFYGDSGYKNLYAVIADLFMAGAETTANTLTWAILYLVTFPNVQKRLQEEIDQVVGNRRLPTLDDKPQMPYAEAILLEVLRFSPTVVMGMFHYCTSSTKFHGYDIPEGSYICSNFHWVHRDPEVWGDPENFRPERFLSEDGSSIIKYDEFLGFSCGKRICLGEVLARDEFFLFLTGLFQRFDVKLEGEASLDPAPSFMNVAKKFEVVMTDRME
jgi:cytochrome P450